METANHGLSEDSASPAGSSASSPPAPATPTPGPAPAPPPEQSASSVRELESAMSRHLPEPKKLRTSEMTDPASAASATSHLLKQFYSGSASSYPGLSLGPAQPVALKPSLYLDQFPDQPPGPGLYPGQPLHSLYQRGHSWYPGT